MHQLFSTAARWANKWDAHLDLKTCVILVSLGSSSREIVEPQLPGGGRKERSRVRMPGLRVAEFDLFWELSVGSITQGEQNSVQLLFKGSILLAHKASMPILQQTSGHVRTPAWLNRQLIRKLHRKREAQRVWIEDLTSKEEFRNREGFRKAKAPLELMLARGSKGIKMSC